MGIALGNDDGALDDGQTVDVQRRGKVDSRGHGAVLVDAQEVIGYGDGRGQARVELAGYGRVLGVERLGVFADDDVGLEVVVRRGIGIGRWWGRVRGAELDAVY